MRAGRFSTIGSFRNGAAFKAVLSVINPGSRARPIRRLCARFNVHYRRVRAGVALKREGRVCAVTTTDVGGSQFMIGSPQLAVNVVSVSMALPRILAFDNSGNRR